MKQSGLLKRSLAVLAALSLAAGAIALVVFAKPPKKKSMIRYPQKVWVGGKSDGDAACTVAYYVYSTKDSKSLGGEIK